MIRIHDHNPHWVCKCEIINHESRLYCIGCNNPKPAVKKGFKKNKNGRPYK